MESNNINLRNLYPNDLLLLEFKEKQQDSMDYFKNVLEFNNKADLIEIEKILNSKIQDDSPYTLGLLFPLLLMDLVSIDYKHHMKLISGWYAFYINIYNIDDTMDGDKKTSNAFLPYHLMHIFYTYLFNDYILGTKYEKIAVESMFIAAKFQMQDVKLKYNKIFNKSAISKHKNEFLKIGAAAIASIAPNNASLIMDITGLLQGQGQYRDDLLDFFDDYNSGNYTELLQSLEINYKNEIFNKQELLIKLIENGSLLKITLKIQSQLKNCINLIEGSFQNSDLQNKASYDYLKLSSESCEKLISSLNFLKYKITRFPEQDRGIYLDKVEKQIKIIAQSS